MKKIITHTKQLHNTIIIIAMMIISCSSLLGQVKQEYASNSALIPKGGWTIKDPFKNEVFIENNGQFNKPDGQALKNVQYGINNGELKVYFTPSGLSYHVINMPVKAQYKSDKHEVFEEMEEHLRKHGKVDASLTKYFDDKSAYVNIEWIGADPNARILVSEKVHDNYSFNVKNEIGENFSVIANAYKKLTYKNIYPNIDVEYYFSENSGKELGVKYNIVIHPGGDLSKVKMKYSGMQTISLDKKGNIIAQIPDGNITDHAPDFSYVGSQGNQTQAKFILQDQTVSFDVPNYDKNQKLVIDPWVSLWNTNPVFTSTNDGYTIRIDYNKNVYVMGGGVSNGGFIPSYNYQVKKFNSAGALQWTATGLASTNLGAYGDMVVLRSGKVIVGMGIGAGNTGYILASANGAITTRAVPSVNEFGWRLCYNQTANNGVLWAGGGSNNGAHLIKTDTNLTAATINHPWTTASNTEDIVYLAEDKTSAFVYITNATNSSPNSSTTAPKFCKASTATPGTAVWKVNEPTLMMELGQGSYINNGAAAFARGWSTGLNGMVVCNNRIYTYDGNNIRSHDVANGAIITSATSGGAFDKYSGIAVDNCCRLYVGVNGVVKRYSSTLVFDQSIAVAGNVFDLQLDPLDEKILYVTGKGFVQKLEFQTCPTCINITKTDVSGCTYGSATATVTDPSATAPFTYSWSNGGNTQTISGLTAGTYTVTVTDAALCPPLTWTQTVTITGTYVPCGPTVTATGGVICSGACVSITATGASTPGPFTYAWQPGGLTGASANVCPTATTTYTVVATDGAGATASTTAVVTVNQKPTITLSSGAVCPSACVTITAGGGSTYAWSAPFSGSASTQSACPATTTSYSVTGTDANGCTNTATATVTVNPLPTVTVTNLSVCKDTIGTITASGASTYTWSCGGTGAVKTPNTSVIGVSTCTVTGTDINGCVNTAVSTITVNDCSTPNVTVNDGTICIGNCFNITAVGTGGVGALTYAWNPNIGVGVGPFSVCPTTTTSYTVTVTDANGATATDVAVVTINPLPTITATTATICNGTCATITASGAGTGTYTWSSPLGSGASQNVCPTTTTTYSLTGTDANGCTNTATTTVTVNPIPVVSVPNANICPGGSTVLNATGATTYTWSPATGLSPTIGASVTANPSVTTIYTVIGDSNGCTSSTTVTVTVGALVANAGTDAFICFGASINLNASGGTIFTWTPATGLSNPNISNPSANPTTTTTYTVTVSDGTCSDEDEVVVTVNSAFTLNAAGVDVSCNAACNGQLIVIPNGGTAPYTYSWNTGCTAAACNNICAGNYNLTATDARGCTASATATINQPTVLTAINAKINVSCFGVCDGTASVTANGGTAPYAYAWSPSGGAAANATNLCAGTYTCTVTDANNCTVKTSVNITQPLEIKVTSTGASICPGGTTALTASTTGGSGAINITWSPSTSLSSGTGTSVTANPTATTVYTIAATDANGCIGTTQITVTVNSAPIVNVPAKSICQGTSTSLTATGANTYAWSPATNLSATTGATVTANPTSTITYTVVGTITATGCTNSTTVIVTVNLAPTLTTTSGNACPGDTITLTASGANTYSWSPVTGISPTTGSTVKATPQNTTVYTITGTGVNGCTSTALATATVNPNPIANFITSSDVVDEFNPTVNFIDQSTGGIINKWNWNFGDSLPTISNVQNPSFTYPAVSNRYTVKLTVTNQFGCIDSIDKTVFIRGIFTFYIPNTFTPNGDGTNDGFLPRGVGVDETDYHLWIFDRWGNLIWQTEIWGEAWDGRANKGADISQIDTYVWKVFVKEKDSGLKHNYIGHVNIVK